MGTQRGKRGDGGGSSPAVTSQAAPALVALCHLHPGDVVVGRTPGSPWWPLDPCRGDVVIRAVPGRTVPSYPRCPRQLEHVEGLVPGEWCPQGQHGLCDPAPGLMHQADPWGGQGCGEGPQPRCPFHGGNNSPGGPRGVSRPLELCPGGCPCPGTHVSMAVPRGELAWCPLGAASTRLGGQVSSVSPQQLLAHFLPLLTSCFGFHVPSAGLSSPCHCPHCCPCPGTYLWSGRRGPGISWDGAGPPLLPQPCVGRGALGMRENTLSTSPEHC